MEKSVFSTRSLSGEDCRCRTEKGIRKLCVKCRKRLSYSMNSHGGHRLAVLLRDEFRCVSCHREDLLNVHYRNGNHKDHRLANLITLCARCHARVERSGVFRCNGTAGESLLLQLWGELHPGEYYQPVLAA